MDEILRDNVPFIWTEECTKNFEILKCKLVEAPILRIFLKWSKKFQVHLDALDIVVVAILTRLGDDALDYPNV